MSVDKWAADCAAHVEKLLRAVENGDPGSFERIGENNALRKTTHRIAVKDVDELNDVIASGRIKFDPKRGFEVNPQEGLPWKATHLGWFVVVSSTPEVLTEIIKRLPGDFEHQQLRGDSLRVISSKMPEVERRRLNK